LNKLLKNIMVINDFSHVNGGAAKVALASAIGLAHRGHRVIFFSAVGPDDAAAEAAGVTVIRTDQHDVLQDPNRIRAAMQGIWNTRARRQIRYLLRSLDPAHTVVHLHSWTKALSSSVVREAICQKFAIVCTLHDYFTACPNGGFFDYKVGMPCGQTALSFGCISTNCDPRSYAQKLWRVARQTVQNTFGGIPGGIRHYVSVSDFSERILRRYLPADATIDRVSNPIEVVQREPADVANNGAFVYVGRLSPEKGALTFAQAASHMGVDAIFVGDGPDANKIRAVCPKAEVTGWLTRDLVARHIRLARVLVMPSLWYETEGLVVSEAAAQGIPSIVSDRCAAKDSVMDGRTGLWFAGGDAGDLALKMAAMSRSATAALYGRNAYEAYWASPRTLARHVDELEHLFDRCLIQRAAARQTCVT
jgi:glycosyltransferase involved in cell wall biosynthesis